MQGELSTAAPVEIVWSGRIVCLEPICARAVRSAACPCLVATAVRPPQSILLVVSLLLSSLPSGDGRRGSLVRAALTFLGSLLVGLRSTPDTPIYSALHVTQRSGHYVWDST